MSQTARLPTAQRREQLADAALVILSQHGARGLTVKAIAAAVGISDGAVFRHFADKQALLAAAVARFHSLLSALPPSALPPVERLQRFFIERVTAVKARPEVLGLAFNDRLQEVAGEEAAAAVQKVMQESVSFVRGCVRDAQASGELDAELRPEMVAFMVTGAMRGAARSSLPPEDAWRDVACVLFPSKAARRKR